MYVPCPSALSPVYHWQLGALPMKQRVSGVILLYHSLSCELLQLTSLSLASSASFRASPSSYTTTQMEWSDDQRSINRQTVKTTVCNGSQNVYSLPPSLPASPPSLSAPQFVRTEQNAASITQDKQTIFSAMTHLTHTVVMY